MNIRMTLLWSVVGLMMWAAIIGSILWLFR